MQRGPSSRDTTCCVSPLGPTQGVAVLVSPSSDILTPSPVIAQYLVLPKTGNWRSVNGREGSVWSLGLAGSGSSSVPFSERVHHASALLALELYVGPPRQLGVVAKHPLEAPVEATERALAEGPVVVELDPRDEARVVLNRAGFAGESML